jgi:hypothetical protein|tara:strand:- start:8623 stop:8811 length:189 start_codon:yes stop_codon:yes gene_type:complete
MIASAIYVSVICHGLKTLALTAASASRITNYAPNAKNIHRLFGDAWQLLNINMAQSISLLWP